MMDQNYYDGPKPPPKTGIHHYNIELYALKEKIVLDDTIKDSKNKNVWNI